MSKLRISAMEGQTNQVASLLCDTDFRSRSAPTSAPTIEAERAEALHLAAARGHVEVVRMLLAAGAEANQLFPGGSALHAAVMGDYSEVVALLLEAGAEPDLSDRQLDSRQQGWTALMYAACYGRTRIAQQLLQAGAQPDLADRDGQTPLMIAANAGHAAIALLLIEAGAKLDTQDHYGNTALACALGRGCGVLAQSLAEKAQINLEQRLDLPPSSAALRRVDRATKSRPLSWGSDPTDADHSPSPSAAIAQMP